MAYGSRLPYITWLGDVGMDTQGVIAETIHSGLPPLNELLLKGGLTDRSVTAVVSLKLLFKDATAESEINIFHPP